jgi:hypothetical protein
MAKIPSRDAKKSFPEYSRGTNFYHGSHGKYGFAVENQQESAWSAGARRRNVMDLPDTGEDACR